MELTIVVPCFNEEEVLPEAARRLVALLDRMVNDGRISDSSMVYFVDDGSRDRTWPIIEGLAGTDSRIHGIKLSRNRGHQHALLAGLLTVPGDIVVSVDADLQDDLDAMIKMVDEHASGRDIVLGVRARRDTDSLAKRFTAELYYKLLNLLGVEVVFNHADYRLLSRRALEALAKFEETNIFLRGIIPQLGYSTSVVYYDRQERYAGESKYPLRKMLALAWNGVTSFSAAPLRFITGVGFAIAAGSLAISIWAVWTRLFTDQAVPGWASTVVPIYFLGGIQLLSIGMIGEYVAKIYLESKHRPRFLIERII